MSFWFQEDAEGFLALGHIVSDLTNYNEGVEPFIKSVLLWFKLIKYLQFFKVKTNS